MDTPATQRQRFAAMGLSHFDPALLSNIANAVKDRVPRNVNIKAGIRACFCLLVCCFQPDLYLAEFDDTFTGEQLVVSAMMPPLS